MPIFKGSRYEGVKITGFTTASGQLRAFLHSRNKLSSADIGEDFIIHRVKQGDTIDGLAFEYGGKTRLWWIIADVNDLEFPLDLTINQELIIPSRRVFNKY